MDTEQFEILENKINDLIARYTALKAENQKLTDENNRLQFDAELLKERIDVMLGKLEGV